eukprot:Platyproteum_vivax@DN228_c0_g1_i1.p1
MLSSNIAIQLWKEAARNETKCDLDSIQLAQAIVERLPKEIGSDALPDLKLYAETRSKGYINFHQVGVESVSRRRLDVEETQAYLEKQWPLVTIGVVRSCFGQKYATPRQGSLVPAGRAVFQLAPSIPADSLDDLEGFSHVWIIFLFHESQEEGWKSKVRPPKLQGHKLGVFSSRSPHRPNPIGLSVCRLLKRQGRNLYLGGMDLVDGTPVVDVKPYHCLDCQQGATVPSWLTSNLSVEKKVIITDLVACSLQDYVDSWRQNSSGGEGKCVEETALGGKPPFQFFKDAAEFLQCVRESLAQDPRSVQQMREEGGLYHYVVDGFEIIYRHRDDSFFVESITPDAKPPIAS